LGDIVEIISPLLVPFKNIVAIVLLGLKGGSSCLEDIVDLMLLLELDQLFNNALLDRFVFAYFIYSVAHQITVLM